MDFPNWVNSVNFNVKGVLVHIPGLNDLRDLR